MRPSSLRRLSLVLFAAFTVPACHDGDDSKGPFGTGGSVDDVAGVLSGGQEVPPVPTSASGGATVVVRAAQSAIDFTLTVSGLGSITAAHIHAGKPGEIGPILFMLASGPFTSPLSGTRSSSDFTPAPGKGINTFQDAADAILRGETYVNVHTSIHPDGEIRGHLGPATFNATLSGGSEVPSVVTAGSGSARVELNGDQDSLAYVLTHSGLSSPTTMAHIHAGAPGENGPIIFTLAMGTFSSPLAGTLSTSDLQPAPGKGINTFADAVNALLTGGTYVNVHTTTHPNGEVRGPLVP